MSNKTDIGHDNNYSKSVTVDIIDIVDINKVLHYKVSYAGSVCYIKLYKFELQMLSSLRTKKKLQCVYLGLDEDQIPRLVQDKRAFMDDLYEADTVQSFKYLSTRIDYATSPQKEYHVLSDDYGLTHRFYGELSANQKIPGTEIELYIKSINSVTKNLSLALFDPNMHHHETIFYSAEKVFGEIDELDNKEIFFDCFFTKRYVTKPYSDLTWQYNNFSNLWLFTYLNIIDERLVELLIKHHKIEELAAICRIMIKLQNWMVEESSYLDLFSDETQLNTIQKSSHQIKKYERIIDAVDIVKNSTQHDYIQAFIEKFEDKDSEYDSHELVVVINLLRIYEDYLSEHIKTTIRLVKAINLREEDSISSVLHLIGTLIERRIKDNVKLVNKSIFNSVNVDTSQIMIVNDILSLLIIRILLYKDKKVTSRQDILSAKAKFFKFLSVLAPKDQKVAIAKAGIQASVGILDDSEIFLWENVINLDTTKLLQLTTSAIVWDSNPDNYHIFFKSGLVLLDTTGLTIIPKKQCVEDVSKNLLNNINVGILHQSEDYPLRIASMLNSKKESLTASAVEQYLFWESVYKQSSSIKPMKKCAPAMGDLVRVRVKAQKQGDNLRLCLFVTVDDPYYQAVDGVIHAKCLSTKFVSDVRTLFREGDTFHAKIISFANKKYGLSIKEDMSKFKDLPTVEDEIKAFMESSNTSNVVDLSENIEIITTPPRNLLSKAYVGEVVSLLDVIIQNDINVTNRLTLIGYAHVLCAINGDGRSYYYNALLQEYAYAEKILYGGYDNVMIKEPKTKIAETEVLNSEDSTSCEDEFDFFNDSIEKENPKTENSTNIPVEQQKTRYLVIKENNNITLTEDIQPISDFNQSIEISPLFPDGQILILFSNGEIMKFKMEYLRSLPCDVDWKSDMDSSKVSNYFIIPDDSQVGVIATTKEGKYITLYDTVTIPDSSIDNVMLMHLDIGNIIRHQPFILQSIKSNPLTEYLGRTTAKSSMSDDAIGYMKAFGVFI